mmetsp:Transcript_92596/g.145328  ORF Transcript_92596/g.145328 Transcript_92596/m.145328 type:complete len:243 (-) Transcript_92596:10-738(-)
MRARTMRITVVKCAWASCFFVRSFTIVLTEDKGSTSDRPLRAFAQLLLAFDGPRLQYRALGGSSLQRSMTPLLSGNTYQDRYTAAIEDCKKRKTADLKAELDTRGISHSDLFEKDELVKRVAEARANGEADPDILTDFNKIQLEKSLDPSKDISDSEFEGMADELKEKGLPTGMDPKQVMELAKNPEIMNLMMNPKFQDLMKKQMAEGPAGAQAMLAGDPELRELVEKAGNLMPGLDGLGPR